MVVMNAENIGAERMDGSVAQAMLQQSPECIKVIDCEGHVRFMSENGMQLMEIADFDMVRGALWWDLWPEAVRETLKNSISAASRGVSVVFEGACPTAAGTPKHWRVRVYPVIGGELDGMIIASSQDITDKVEAEATRQRLCADNEALRRFSRFVAHDLRGPIRHHKILAEMISLVDGAEPSSETAELARNIEESANGMLDLLAGLEALHNQEQVAPHPEPLRVGDLIHKVSKLAETARVTITVTPDAAETVIHADRGQMLSILSNLVENAAKFHDGTGPASVTVALGTPDSDLVRRAKTVSLDIIDDGPGFTDERFDDLFEPLVRQSSTTNAAGSGLGLAIVRRLVDLQGGKVLALRTRPDGLPGAAIRLTLPASAALQ